jgi:tRNA (mo5U34)-methyltransferase
MAKAAARLEPHIDRLIRQRDAAILERDAAHARSAGPRELYESALKTTWFHSIDLGDGYFTPGHKSKEQMADEAAQWQFPSDLTGKTVLDIGCADGAWGVLALRRGAKSVLAIDEQMTVGLQFLLKSGTFPFEFRNISLFSDQFMALPSFDFVIFAGVLYHLQDPLAALHRLRRVTGGQALLETHINGVFGDEVPYLVFYEGAELNDDPTNWVGPNLPRLEAMIRTAGFSFQRTHHVYASPSNGRASYLLWPK